MELKDVILSTLAEMENDDVKEPIKEEQEIKLKKNILNNGIKLKTQPIEEIVKEEEKVNLDSELVFLKSTRERLLVLFEGFQAPNNTNIESKIDLTLNFLELMLAKIDERVEALDKGII